MRYSAQTDMMEAIGNNVAPVMSYSANKSLETFKIYPHAPTEGLYSYDQRIESVALFVVSFTGERIREQREREEEGYHWKSCRCAVSEWRCVMEPRMESRGHCAENYIPARSSCVPAVQQRRLVWMCFQQT